MVRIPHKELVMALWKLKVWLFVAIAALGAVGLSATHAQATTVDYVNEHPEIQMWSYPAGSANGPGSVRDRGPTFGAFSFLNENDEREFYEGSEFDPSRRGSYLIVADTSSDIPVGLAPRRYRIDSIRVTTSLLGSLIYEPLGYVLHYDNTLDDAVAMTTTGDPDVGKPMEMYGLGFQGDYQTVSFDPEQTAPQYFQLGDKRWKSYQPGDPEYDPANPNAISPYQFFGVDAEGRDVENSIVGGYSATESGNVATQFTPTPFAIGKLYDAPGVETAPGTLVGNGDKFVYEPSLAKEGIVSYIQQSLAGGFLGFSFSSLHEPAGHEGTAPYPDFYLDDLDVGNNPNGAAPKIELQVTILNPSQPGDYDGDEDVDGQDFLAWQRQLGSSAAPMGSGADGSGNGVIDGPDLTMWRDHFGVGGTDSHAASGQVPEPVSGVLVGASVVGILQQGRRRRASGGR
jgi:hypothetical protein